MDCGNKKFQGFMKIIKIVLDYSCLVLIVAFFLIVISLIALTQIDKFGSSSVFFNLILAKFVKICVFLFSVSAVLLWIYAIREVWVTASERPLIKSLFYFLLVIGFSWIAGLVVYQRTKDKLLMNSE